MFDENQLIEMHWNNCTKKWYESKGYIFTKKNDVFFVKAKDLMPSSKKIVKAICDYCGKEYNTLYNTIVEGRISSDKDCCRSCCQYKAHELGTQKRITERFNKIKNICQERGYELITTIDEYVNGNTIITYLCPNHGIQSVKANYLCGGSGCIECAREKINNSNKLDIDYIKSVIENDGNIWCNPDEYIKASTNNLLIQCKCKNTYVTSFSSYVHYNVTKCPVCSNKESKAETCIKNILCNCNILFEQEKSFKECRDIHALPFDFYLPEYNVCIEFNGKQHYVSVDYFGGDEQFKKRQKHDKIKYEYCQQNNIKLICIPYWDENNIDSILIRELNL